MQYENVRMAKVLRPTEKEFKNFRKFVEKIYNDPAFREEGCIKVTLIRLFHPRNTE